MSLVRARVAIEVDVDVNVNVGTDDPTKTQTILEVNREFIAQQASVELARQGWPVTGTSVRTVSARVMVG